MPTGGACWAQSLITHMLSHDPDTNLKIETSKIDVIVYTKNIWLILSIFYMLSCIIMTLK